jgi:hypothetical protein
VKTLLFLVTLLVSPLTARAWPPGDTTGLTIQFQNLTRSYNVHVPASYDSSVPVPLVLDFHAYSSTPAFQESVSGFNTLAESVGFIVVYPQGYSGNGGQPSWNAGACCDPALADGIDDVGFARAIVADVDLMGSRLRPRAERGDETDPGDHDAAACAVPPAQRRSMPPSRPQRRGSHDRRRRSRTYRHHGRQCRVQIDGLQPPACPTSACGNRCDTPAPERRNSAP